jgi:hypothetical protein
MINTLSTFQTFGIPYSVCDEEAIDIVYGDMLRENYEITDKLNYSAITLIPCEIYSISKKNFKNFIKDRIITGFKANLITIHPDWVLRKYFIHNSGWENFKQNYVDNKRMELLI